MKVRVAVSVGLGAPDAEQLAMVVTEAEARGFDSLWFSDVPLLPATDPFLAVAFAAAHSRRLKLGTNLVPFGYEPFVFARQVAQLDHLSHGRLLVTLVPGLDQPGERAALGIGRADRGARLDRLIPDLKAWWAGEPVVCGSGGLAVALPARPVQEPLEIWLGGSGPKAIARAGQLGDGWLGSLVSPVRAGAIRAAIQVGAAAAGRTIDPEHFGLSVPYAHHADDLGALPQGARPRDPDYAALVPIGRAGLRRLIGQLVDHGLSKFVVRPVGPVRSWAAELEWLADAVLDLQT